MKWISADKTQLETTPSTATVTENAPWCCFPALRYHLSTAYHGLGERRHCRMFRRRWYHNVTTIAHIRRVYLRRQQHVLTRGTIFHATCNSRWQGTICGRTTRLSSIWNSHDVALLLSATAFVRLSAYVGKTTGVARSNKVGWTIWGWVWEGVSSSEKIIKCCFWRACFGIFWAS